MLFDRYYRPLVLYAGTLISDDTMAEDLVQEFFVRLWEDDYLERIESKALSSYLFSSVRNSCYTYLHKNDVMRARVDFTSIDVAADSAAALSQEIVDRVTAVIALMPEQTGRAELRVDAGYEISGNSRRVACIPEYSENFVAQRDAAFA